jgi:LytS/YehU family sensor histidine kinase
MRRKFLLGFLFSLLVPALNLVNSDVVRRVVDYRRAITSWLVGFVFLMLTWMVNQALRDRTTRWWVYGAVNVALILGMQPVLRVLAPFRVGGDVSPWFISIRLVMAVTLVLLFQSALKAIETKEAMALYNQQLLNENLKARFDALREQVNPHFLFNSLGTLRSMVRPDNPGAEQFILHLSDVYRQLLTRKDGVTVSLSEELDFLRSYLHMLEARFEGNFTVSIKVPEEALAKRVPSFCLQLLVENCIKHNVVSAEYPLRVQVYAERGESVVVSNRRRPKNVRDDSGGMGLANLRKRYEWLGIPDGVRVMEDADAFTVSLTFVPS